MEARKNRCPSTVPWGTPELTGACADVSPFRTTLVTICEEVGDPHQVVITDTIVVQLVQQTTVGTLSKALENSSDMMSNCFWSSMS